MDTFNAIVAILTAISVIALPIGVILGIVFLVIASGEEKERKKKLTLTGIASLVIPVLLLLLLLSLWGLIRVITQIV